MYFPQQKQKLNWRARLKEALDRTEFMAIATTNKKASWVCAVQFSYDNKLNLYFKSMPQSRHMLDIKINPNVSLVIFSTNRLPNGDVVGLQIKGKAIILSTYNTVAVAAKHHYGRSRTAIDYKSRINEHLGKNARWNFVKIAPSEVWYFDTRFFDEERQGRQKVTKKIYNEL